MEWVCGSHRFDLAERPLVMGILNATPDSFSDGYPTLRKALNQAERLLEAGADIVDVGGESTRPGSDSVPAEVEIERVVPVIRHLVRDWQAVVSIDTQKVAVARAAVDAGATIVNHVSASLDVAEMVPLLSRTQVGYVAMHMKDRPAVMQRKAVYHDAVAEVGAELEAVGATLSGAGIAMNRVLFDPGIGFGKRLEHNLDLLRSCNDLADRLNRPLLLGLSRKSWLRNLLQVEKDELDTLDALTAIASLHLPAGFVAVHRVHNVELLVKGIKLIAAMTS